MNVFIWEGTDRENAVKSVIRGNGMPTIGDTYSVDASSGFLIVAYPNIEI